jgi:probable F420-dependent oxidoreductase
VKLAAVVPYWLDRPSIEAIEVARTAERAGLEELWVGEMLTFDAFALAGAVARETPAITIVCGPLASLVRSPVALALGIASVTQLAGRTTHLALGASTPTVVESWHGRPWTNRAARTKETVAAVRSALAGERIDGFRLRDPVPEAEVRVAAFGPLMLRTAVACADAVVVNLLTPQAVARVKHEVTQVAREIGATAPALAAWVPAAYEPGPATFDQLRRQLAVYVAQPGYGDMFARAGFADVVERARGAGHPSVMAELVPDALVEAVCVLGSEAILAERFGEYAAAGVDMLCVVPATAEDSGGEKVLHAVAGLR